MSRALVDECGDCDAVKGHVGHDARYQTLGSPHQRRQHDAEHEQPRELQWFGVGEGEERRTECDTEDHARTRTAPTAALAQRTKDHATKEPFPPYRGPTRKR